MKEASINNLFFFYFGIEERDIEQSLLLKLVYSQHLLIIEQGINRRVFLFFVVDYCRKASKNIL